MGHLWRRRYTRDEVSHLQGRSYLVVPRCERPHRGRKIGMIDLHCLECIGKLSRICRIIYNKSDIAIFGGPLRSRPMRYSNPHAAFTSKVPTDAFGGDMGPLAVETSTSPITSVPTALTMTP